MRGAGAPVCAAPAVPTAVAPVSGLRFLSVPSTQWTAGEWSETVRTWEAPMHDLRPLSLPSTTPSRVEVRAGRDSQPMGIGRRPRPPPAPWPKVGRQAGTHCRGQRKEGASIGVGVLQDRRPIGTAARIAQSRGPSGHTDRPREAETDPSVPATAPPARFCTPSGWARVQVWTEGRHGHCTGGSSCRPFAGRGKGQPRSPAPPDVPIYLAHRPK